MIMVVGHTCRHSFSASIMRGRKRTISCCFILARQNPALLFAQTMAFQNACCRVWTKAQPNKNCSGARGCATRVCFSACAPKDSGSSFLILYDIDDPWMCLDGNGHQSALCSRADVCACMTRAGYQQQSKGETGVDYNAVQEY